MVNGGFPLAAFGINTAVSAVVVAAALAVTFAVAVRQRRHSVIDVTWGAGFALVAVATAVLATATGHGDPVRTWTV